MNVSGVLNSDFANKIDRNCDFNQEKSITFSTEKVTRYDEGHPYQTTIMKVTEKSADEPSKVTHQYAITRNPSEEVASMVSRINSFFARQQYEQHQVEADNSYNVCRENYIY